MFLQASALPLRIHCLENTMKKCKMWLLSVVLCSGVGLVQGQSLISLESFHEGLAMAREQEAWGFIDKKGKWAIVPQFEMVYSFSEGMAGFMRSGKWGFVDVKGKWVIDPKFQEIRPFSEGLAAVRDENGRWGYIDKSGNWAIQPQYIYVQPFSEGLAMVKGNDDQAIFIKKDGTTAIGGGFLLARNFKNGYAFANRGGQHFWINTKGKKVLNCPGAVFFGEFTYSNGFDVSEGLVAFKAEKGNVLGYQDMQGKTVVPAQYLECKAFYKGVALVKTKNKNWILIDKNGQALTDETTTQIHVDGWPTDYLKANPPYEENTPQPRIYGLLNLKGAWVLKPAYFNLGSFSEGLIAAYDAKVQRFGYINARGKWKIKAKSEEEPQVDEVKVEARY
jgi:hypothetical protein